MSHEKSTLSQKRLLMLRRGSQITKNGSIGKETKPYLILQRERKKRPILLTILQGNSKSMVNNVFRLCLECLF
jgi:hypothetical protein